MTTSTLHATLESLARDFARSLLAAVRSASFAELRTVDTEGASKTNVSHKSRPAARTATKSKKSATKRVPYETSERTNGASDRLREIVRLLRARGQGLGADGIRSVVGLDEETTTEAINLGLVTGYLTKRGTRYFAK